MNTTLFAGFDIVRDASNVERIPRQELIDRRENKTVGRVKSPNSISNKTIVATKNSDDDEKQMELLYCFGASAGITVTDATTTTTATIITVTFTTTTTSIAVTTLLLIL